MRYLKTAWKWNQTAHYLFGIISFFATLFGFLVIVKSFGW
jgi:hypothetical protein